MGNTAKFIISRRNWNSILNDRNLNLSLKQKEILNKKISKMNEEESFISLAREQFFDGFEKSDSIYDNIEL